MDTDQPTTVPDQTDDARRDAASSRSPRRSMMGLPVRLALLTLLLVAIFTAGIVAFADSRIQDAADDRAAESATLVARSLARQFSELDFEPAQGDAKSQLVARLERAVQGEAGVRSIQLYAADKRSVLPVAGSTKPNGGAEERAARAALRDREPVVTTTGDSARIAWPVTFADGRPGGVIAVDVDTSDAMTAASESRTRLILGAIVAGSLLGLALLLLLRRELFRPLDQLRGVMSQIRSGARGVRIGWNRSDELGAVANEFDAMVAELEAAQTELARFVNRDPLTGLLTADAFTERLSGELTRARREGYPITLLAIDVDDLDEINRTHDRLAGDQVLASLGEIIGGCTRPTDSCGRTGGDSFHIALIGADAAQAAVVIQRIRREVAQRVGIGPERTRVTVGFGVSEYPTHAVDQLTLERMARSACAHAQRDGRDRALAFGPSGGYVDALSLVPETLQHEERPTGERELASTVHALARALDGIDPALGGGAHSQRVARFAVALAHELGLGEAQIRQLRSAAVLHDVGKVAVPPSVLRTPEDELDERQKGAMRYHAWVSRTMIAGAGLSDVADIVFHIPERWDGTGYPERQSEDAISIESRILRAAELLDHLTTGYAGQRAMNEQQVATELKRRAGGELDPDVAVTLARLVREEGLLGTSNMASDSVADAA